MSSVTTYQDAIKWCQLRAAFIREQFVKDGLYSEMRVTVGPLVNGPRYVALVAINEVSEIVEANFALTVKLAQRKAVKRVKQRLPESRSDV